MNVEIGAEAAQFPEKEYTCINGIAVAVRMNVDQYKPATSLNKNRRNK
jgi:hypothetical protein